MPIYQPTPENLSLAAELLRCGKLVAFPTETVYGLGAHAFDAQALAKIFEVKGRPANNPLIVHVGNAAEVSKVVAAEKLTAAQRALLDTLSSFWPGPLSLVLPAHAGLPRIVTAGRDTVAVRVPAHPVAQELLRLCAFPIAAPSANPSSYVSPTTAYHVEQSLAGSVDMILDGGACRLGIESTILSLMETPPRLLRAGALTRELLEAKVGPLASHSGEDESGPLPAPGMLSEHYAPHTPLILRGTAEPASYPSKVGLVAFHAQSRREFDYHAVIELSRTQELEQVATGLFAALREMDSRGLDLIVVDTCEERGLGLAIMDRLLRAAARRGA